MEGKLVSKDTFIAFLKGLISGKKNKNIPGQRIASSWIAIRLIQIGTKIGNAKKSSRFVPYEGRKSSTKMVMAHGKMMTISKVSSVIIAKGKTKINEQCRKCGSGQDRNKRNVITVDVLDLLAKVDDDGRADDGEYARC